MNIIHIQKEEKTEDEIDIYNDDSIFMVRKKIINHYNKNHRNKKSLNEIYLFTEISYEVNNNIIVKLFNSYSTEGILLPNNIDIINKNLNLKLDTQKSLTFESFEKAHGSDELTIFQVALRKLLKL